MDSTKFISPITTPPVPETIAEINEQADAVETVAHSGIEIDIPLDENPSEEDDLEKPFRFMVNEVKNNNSDQSDNVVD